MSKTCDGSFQLIKTHICKLGKIKNKKKRKFKGLIQDSTINQWKISEKIRKDSGVAGVVQTNNMLKPEVLVTGTHLVRNLKGPTL